PDREHRRLRLTPPIPKSTSPFHAAAYRQSFDTSLRQRFACEPESRLNDGHNAPVEPAHKERFMSRSSKLPGLIVIGALLLPAAILSADTLVLRDGRRIQGQLISFQNGVIEFQESGFGGQIGRINRDQVTGIELGFDNNNSPSSQNRDVGRPRGLR